MTVDHRVSLVACEQYDSERVEDAIRRSINLLGGIEAFVGPGQRIVLKPNLLRPSAPSAATTTHPSVVAAVARLVSEAGAQAIILDSPGGPNSAAYVRTVYRSSGMIRAAEQSGAELITNLEPTQVANPDGIVLRRLDLVRQAVEADAIINLAKLKTHSLVGLTLSVKNLFGLVPGVVKVGYHARFEEPADFALGLLDIARVAKPVLHIIDGVVGMEGNGPSAGTPRQVGALIAGADPLNVDIVAASLIGVDPLETLTTRVAVEHGLTMGRLEDVELVGDALDALRVPRFRLSDSQRSARLSGQPGASRRGNEGNAARQSWFGRLALGWLAKQVLAVPHAGPRCTGCGFCARNCPVQAIEIVDGRARMDLSACIRCYCCHELCPELAIELRRPLLGRLVDGTR